MNNQAILSFQDVQLSYHKKEIIHHLSLQVSEGSITTLIGPNGCGKSTLLRSAARLLALSGGSILLWDKPISSYKKLEYAKMLSLFPQCREIPDITAEQFVRLGRFPYYGPFGRPSLRDKEAAEQAIQATGVTQFSSRKLKELSGGERQKVYFALLLAQDCPLVLLDEPSTFLDISQQFELLNQVRAFAKQGKSVLMVLHDISQALTYSDYIGVMSNGSLLAFGTPDELLRGDLINKVFQITVRQTFFDNKKNYVLLPK